MNFVIEILESPNREIAQITKSPKHPGEGARIHVEAETAFFRNFAGWGSFRLLSRRPITLSALLAWFSRAENRGRRARRSSLHTLQLRPRARVYCERSWISTPRGAARLHFLQLREPDDIRFPCIAAERSATRFSTTPFPSQCAERWQGQRCQAETTADSH